MCFKDSVSAYVSKVGGNIFWLKVVLAKPSARLFTELHKNSAQVCEVSCFFCERVLVAERFWLGILLFLYTVNFYSIHIRPKIVAVFAHNFQEISGRIFF